MQVIAEAYAIMRALGMSNAEMSTTFAEWNSGRLESFLIEITAEILATRSPDGEAVIDVIVDSAGQKGTGRWTAMYGFELGQPVGMIAEAVIARVVSALVDERHEAAGVLSGPDCAPDPDAVTLGDIADALYASKVVSYAQGFSMLAAASDEHDWDLDLGGIAAIWRAGCIIRAAFLDDITSVFTHSPDIANLLLADTFAEAVQAAQPGWRATLGVGIANGIPLPAFGSALAFYDGYRCERLPANLIQAQRDHFGAHTYERIDRPRGEHFHTDWTGDAGETPAGD